MDGPMTAFSGSQWKRWNLIQAKKTNFRDMSQFLRCSFCVAVFASFIRVVFFSQLVMFEWILNPQISRVMMEEGEFATGKTRWHKAQMLMRKQFSWTRVQYCYR